MSVNSKKNNYQNNTIKESERCNILEFPEKNNTQDNLIELKKSEVIIKNKSGNYSEDIHKTDNIVKFENPNNKSNLPPKNIIFLILFGIVVIAIIWFFTNKNAIEVYIDNKPIGIIKQEDITADDLTDTSLAKLREELGTDIKVNEEVSIKPVHASKKDMVSVEAILSDITKKYTFQVEAASIVVNGQEIAVVKNEDEAKKVLGQIASKYVKEDTKAITTPTFVENVEIKSKFVSENDILKDDTAFSLLNINSEQGKKYSIKSGDTLSKIAKDSSMTIDELLKINPDLTENSMLKIGQEINLIVPVPLLSVVVEEQTTYTELIKKPIETIKNNKEYKTYRKVISAGKDGTKEVTAKIKKVNGVEQDREIVSEKVIAEPVVEKVEVGTLNTPPKKAIGTFIYPVSGARLTSGYGKRGGTTHRGIDLACSYGTPIKASDGGTVVFSGWGNGYGNMVKISHGNGLYTIYGHNSKNVVSVGQKVAQGEVIGYVGSTGNSTGNHVHFEIIQNGASKNPLNYLK